MKTVLLTGASGYIGKHITKRLLTDGYAVRGLSPDQPVRGVKTSTCREFLSR